MLLHEGWNHLRYNQVANWHVFKDQRQHKNTRQDIYLVFINFIQDQIDYVFFRQGLGDRERALNFLPFLLQCRDALTNDNRPEMTDFIRKTFLDWLRNPQDSILSIIRASHTYFIKLFVHRMDGESRSGTAGSALIMIGGTTYK